MNKSKGSNKSYIAKVNKSIKAENVRCINKYNKNIGIIPTKKALKLAEDEGLDLVQVSSMKDKIPTCKIIDYGKYKYNRSKQQKELAKKQRQTVTKIKQIQFRPSTSKNDLQIKAKKAAEFLKEGHNLKVSVLFKGRERSHKNVALQQLHDFINFLNDFELSNEENYVAKMVEQPRMDGSSLSTQVILYRNSKKNLEKAS